MNIPLKTIATKIRESNTGDRMYGMEKISGGEGRNAKVEANMQKAMRSAGKSKRGMGYMK